LDGLLAKKRLESCFSIGFILSLKSEFLFNSFYIIVLNRFNSKTS